MYRVTEKGLHYFDFLRKDDFESTEQREKMTMFDWNCEQILILLESGELDEYSLIDIFIYQYNSCLKEPKWKKTCDEALWAFNNMTELLDWLNRNQLIEPTQ